MLGSFSFGFPELPCKPRSTTSTGCLRNIRTNLNAVSSSWFLLARFVLPGARAPRTLAEEDNCQGILVIMQLAIAGIVRVYLCRSREGGDAPEGNIDPYAHPFQHGVQHGHLCA